jgi:hypothetical protein
VDARGQVAIAGNLYGTVNVGGPLTSMGLSDVMVAKLGHDGTPFWSKRFGDSQDQRGYAIATDGFGNLGVTGYFTGQLSFGGTALVAGSGENLFVAKLGP